MSAVLPDLTTRYIAMYARGMTVREIRAFLAEQYGTDVSHDFISSVTDAVLEEISVRLTDELGSRRR